MAWTAPMTAVDGTAFTAAQFNANVRDNLLETMPAKALTVGDYFVSTGNNSIAARRPIDSFIGTAQTTASTTYTDLATVGPGVTAQVDAFAFLFYGAEVTNATNTQNFMAIEVAGGVLPANDNYSMSVQSGGGATKKYGNFLRLNLSPGVYTITAKYRVGGGTATFSQRSLALLNF